MRKPEEPAKTMPNEAFANLGGGSIAYVKPMRSEDVNELFPGTPDLQPGLELWALLSADGAPIILADSREAAVAGAMEKDLTTVSVH